MDYIQERLLRQEVALEALLVGQLPSAQKATREELAREADLGNSAFSRQADMAAAVQMDLSLLSQGEFGGQAGGQQRSRVSDAVAGMGQAASSGALPEAGPAGKRESISSWSSAGGPKTKGQASAFPLGRETMSSAGGLVEFAGTARTVDAQTVSRAIERDARRYDGGFSMY